MSRRRIRAALVLLAGIVLVTGCASVIPEALQEQVDREVQFSDLHPDPDRFEGRMVVLGGRIAALRPADGVTELEVRELPLEKQRESPRVSAQSGGRFLVAHHGSLDPDRYRPGRLVTIVGVVQGGRVLPGQDIPKPVIASEYIHLWPDLSSRRHFAPGRAWIYSHDPFHGFRSFRHRFRPFRSRFCY